MSIVIKLLFLKRVLFSFYLFQLPTMTTASNPAFAGFGGSLFSASSGGSVQGAVNTEVRRELLYIGLSYFSWRQFFITI